ncbi:MAG: hypothetical protein PW845_02890 [Pseudomonas sp.]|uniref:hypothetical protein n=1 Tax=Pseudomonas abieticivorans TaxID=2931382 RepID=UPI0020BF76CC|nr:hypothetical protein [Pseudomonas sp. PIA16]MDE1164341.1 hypothetical protein [Pseudomonas sp.]
MTSITPRPYVRWALPALLALQLALLAGCSSQASSKCYAKALPTRGEGGLAWGASENIARHKSLEYCARYASRSGGTPDTCKVVLAQCK